MTLTPRSTLAAQTLECAGMIGLDEQARYVGIWFDPVLCHYRIMPCTNATADDHISTACTLRVPAFEGDTCEIVRSAK